MNRDTTITITLNQSELVKVLESVKPNHPLTVKGEKTRATHLLKATKTSIDQEVSGLRARKIELQAEMDTIQYYLECLL
jgi:hypothetical protein